MTRSADPLVHRQREQQFVEHVDRLLDDARLRIDTLTGRRPIVSLGRRIRKDDRQVDLIRQMSQMGKPDRELQSKMPVGSRLWVTLWKQRFFFLKRDIGQLRVVCVSPTRSLLAGEEGAPLSLADARRLVEESPPAPASGPATIVVMSTSGFAPQARELAERRVDRTVVLVQPNDAGGWRVSGPNETPELISLFDPESDPEKRARIRAQVELARADLLSAGSIGADRIAGATQLPLELVESELKSYASANPGMAARRLDGRLVLFREGAAPAQDGGSDMPFLQRLKALFSRKPDPAAKALAMAEARARLTQRRDLAYDEIALLERKESDLKQQFAAAPSELARKRITAQILQLRKDQERRQQILGMLNQQVNVISTQLHNIELVQQGKSAQLPTTEELAQNAAEAERILTDLQVTSEMAGESAATGLTGMSDEEQALYDELQRDAAGAKAKEEAQKPTERAAPQESPPAHEPIIIDAPAASPQKRKTEAEPG